MVRDHNALSTLKTFKQFGMTDEEYNDHSAAETEKRSCQLVRINCILSEYLLLCLVAQRLIARPAIDLHAHFFLRGLPFFAVEELFG